MKKKLFLMFALLISIFLVCINNGKCDIENQSNNQNGSIRVDTDGNINSSPSYFDGNLMQGIYVRIYDGNNNQLKSGIDGTYFFVYNSSSGSLPALRNGIKGYYLCDPISNSYSFEKYTKNANTCKPITLDSLNSKFKNGNYILNGGKLFDLKNGNMKAYSEQFTTALGNDSNNYATFNRILKDMGYFNLSNTSLKDYAVIEPVVTIIAGNSSSNRNVYIGTVNALIQNNIAFRGGIGGWNAINVYTVIASSYRSKLSNGTTNACKSKDYATTPASYRIVDNVADYNGCGYNKYVISEKVKYCQKDPNKNIYYKRDGSSTTDVEEYKNSCECYQTSDNRWHIKFGDGKSYNYDDPIYVAACHPVTDIECVIQAADNNPFSRINLFKECRDNGCKLNSTGTVESKTYEKLLKFDEKDGVKACKSRDALKTSISCLNSSYNVDDSGNILFTANDLSNFTDTNGDIAPGSTAYCSYGFKLTGTQYSSSAVNPGRFYLGGTTNPEDEIARGVLTLKCFLYVENPNNYKSKDPFGNQPYELYNKYIGMVAMKDTNTPLAYSIVSNPNTVQYVNLTNKYVEYTKTITVSYKMPAVNIEKVSGFVVDLSSDNTETRYGFYSLYSDDAGIHEDPFIVNYKYDKTYKAYCNYSVSKPELKLEFRTIDTRNPFTGKDNTLRNVGANWCSEEEDGTWDCSGTNNLVKKYIINRNNSYNVLNQKPLYKFVLTPDTIKAIKNYNKNVTERGEDIVIVRENGKDVYQFFRVIESSMDSDTRNKLLP